MSKDLKDKTPVELERLVTELGQKRYLAGYIFHFIHVENVTEISEITPLSKAFRQKLFEQGYLISRLTVVKKLTELQPDLPAGHLALYTLYGRLENTEQAVASMRQALRIDPDNWRYRLILAEFLRRRERFAEAATEYEKVIQAQPKQVPIYVSLAECYGKLKRYHDRMQTYQKMVDNNPKDPVGYNQIAWFLAQDSKDLDQAIELAQRGIDICKQSEKYDDTIRGTIIDTLGWAYFRKAEESKDAAEQKGLLVKAMENFEEAIKLVPANPTVGYHLCAVYEKVEKYREAYVLGKRIIERFATFDEQEHAEKDQWSADQEAGQVTPAGGLAVHDADVQEEQREQPAQHDNEPATNIRPAYPRQCQQQEG